MHNRVLAFQELTDQQAQWASNLQCDKMARQKHHVCLFAKEKVGGLLADR